jgi:hypothetical protein
MKAYTGILIVLTALMTYLIVTRESIDISVSRVKGQLYQEIGTDSLGNLFSAKIINKTRNEVPYEMKLDGIPGTVRMINSHKMVLDKESITDVNFFIDIPKSSIKKRTTDVNIGVYSNGKKIQDVKSKFLGPFI